MSITDTIKKMFGYSAAKDSLARSSAGVVLTSEDRELNARDRLKVIARSRELSHDFALVRWALGKHADYTSRFRFQSQTGIKELDNRIDMIIYEWSKRGNFEITGRHTLNEFMRLAEISRTVDGDVGILKLENGMVQAVESDRIRTPGGIDTSRTWIHGVRTDDSGRAAGYAVHRRTQYGNYRFEREISAADLILHGYYTRFDQIRGIGLLTSAANMFKDVSDCFDYAVAKAKTMQLFGLKYTRSDDAEPLSSAGQQAHETAMEERRLALKGKASYLLELQQGESIETIESGQPSMEFQDYTKLMILIALKSLDICYSMLDEKHTNFYGSRAGIMQYVESCKPKRESNQTLLEHLTRWRLAREVREGHLILPEGMTVNDCWFEWTPAGIPWWKPDEEAKGLLTAITSGFDSYSSVCRTLGKDFKDIVEERKRDEEFARQMGVILPTMTDNINLNIGT